MSKTSYNLYDFLTWCGGNWRNAIYIFCSPCRERHCPNNCRGCLMCADRDGVPKVVTITHFETTTGQKVDPSECLGSISLSAFEAAYLSYLYWELESGMRCPLLRLEEQLSSKSEEKHANGKLVCEVKPK